MKKKRAKIKCEVEFEKHNILLNKKQKKNPKQTKNKNLNNKANLDKTTTKEPG